MSAAVILHHHKWDQDLTDSKKLSESRRQYWSEKIWAEAQVSLGVASVEEIEVLNILQASLLSMKRAILGLGHAEGKVLIDGNQKIPNLDSKFKQQTFVKGDLRLAPISAASIVAKVARDTFMKELAQEFPKYGFEIHKGYATALHRKAIVEWGLTPQHRRTFGNLQEMSKSKT
ncbi:MAG: ribonuclease HII [Bdellovibrionales bacterium]